MHQSYEVNQQKKCPIVTINSKFVHMVLPEHVQWVRDATFQEISWNQEISVRKKELQE